VRSRAADEDAARLAAVDLVAEEEGRSVVLDYDAGACAPQRPPSKTKIK